MDPQLTKWKCRCLLAQLAKVKDIIALLQQLEGGLTPANQSWLLNYGIKQPTRQLFPSDPAYERSLLKAVVLAAEAECQEVDEALMQEFARHLQHQDAGDVGSTSAAVPGPGWCYKCYAYAPASEPPAATMRKLEALQHNLAATGRQETGGDAQHGLMTVHLTSNMFEGGTGCHEWQAGHFLAAYVFSNPLLFAGKACLELGCGTGMAGVALHRVSAAHVTLTDGNMQALLNCAANLHLNGVPVADSAFSPAAGQVDSERSMTPASGSLPGASRRGVQVQRLVWEHGWQPGSSGVGGALDAVLGADLLYDPDIVPTLLRLLTQLLQDGARRGGAAGGIGAACRPAAYLATMLRNEASLARFVAAAEADPGLELEDITGEALGSVAAGVQFCHLAPVEGPWRSIRVHRLQLAC